MYETRMSWKIWNIKVGKQTSLVMIADIQWLSWEPVMHKTTLTASQMKTCNLILKVNIQDTPETKLVPLMNKLQGLIIMRQVKLRVSIYEGIGL